MNLFLDAETFSAVPIKHGTYAYAEGAEVLLLAWAIDDAPASVWDCTAGDRMPARLRMALDDEAVTITAHNAQFDRVLLACIGDASAQRAAAAVERWRCTMARSLCHGLPGALQGKHDGGKTLIHLFCKPRADGGRNTSDTHPAEWARFVAYAARDIAAMREAAATLPEWNYRDAELALWHRDQRINERGFAVDVELAAAAASAVDGEQRKLSRRMRELTDGEVTSALRRDLLLTHLLVEHGVNLPGMRAATVDRCMTDPTLPPELRELLAVRQQASTSSTAKYAALLRSVGADGRLRGTMQYSGAARTRRWSGRLFQPQNLSRPTMRPADIATGIAALKAGCADMLADDVMALASNALRGCIVAAPGRKLVASDLSNIEGRCAAWLGGERWKLDAFRAFDACEGPDLYKVAYAKAFAIAPEAVTPAQRQIGKVMELMLQYGGGVGAFAIGAAAYGIDLDAMADAAWPSIPQGTRDAAAQFLAWCKSEKRATFGLADRTFAACDALKRMWRAAHPGIVALWAGMDEAARAATVAPDRTLTPGMFRVRRDGAWLRIRLPSGNYLCYPQPAVASGELTYAGTNQYTRQWGRQSTYGGKLLENACQSLARDVMASAMPAIEAAGYPIVLTVHDEVITEPPDSAEFSAAGLSALLATPAPWAAGLPLAASGFDAQRYGKH